MDLPSELPRLSYDSCSSSVYSQDEWASEVNSSGTQVHHRSHLRPSIDRMPREIGQTFEPLSNISRHEAQDDSTDDLHNGSTAKALYRFETAMEAASRHLEERDYTRADRANRRSSHLHAWKQNISSDHVLDKSEEVDRAGFSPYSWNSHDGWFSQIGTMPLNTSPEEPSRIASHESEKPHEDLLTVQLKEADSPLRNDPTSGLGNPIRGYSQGSYVTELERLEELPVEKPRKRDSVRKFFCLQH